MEEAADNKCCVEEVDDSEVRNNEVGVAIDIGIVLYGFLGIANGVVVAVE